MEKKAFALFIFPNLLHDDSTTVHRSGIAADKSRERESLREINTDTDTVCRRSVGDSLKS